MSKKLIILLIVICGCLNLWSQEVGGLFLLEAKEDIYKYFKKNQISIQELKLKTHPKFAVITAYPYSGNDTINVYFFTQFGPRWTLQMQYFALRPSNRTLSVQETEKEIILLDGDKKLIVFLAEVKN